MAIISYASLPIHDYHVAYYYVVLPLTCAWSWYMFLTAAYRVEISNDKTIHCRSIWRSENINPTDINWIRESIGFLVIDHAKRKTRISTLVNNTGGIKSAIKSLNPDIKTKYRRYRGGLYK